MISAPQAINPFGAARTGVYHGLQYPQGAGTAAFSPSNIPGLERWFMADGTLWQDSARTTPAVADADPVGAWDDASGNGGHVLQATAGKRPLLKLNILNTKPVVRFDTTDDTLAGTISADASRTIYTVSKVTGDGHTVWSLGSQAQLFVNTPSGAGFLWFANQAAGFTSLGGTPTSFTVVTVRVNSTASLDGYINSAAATNLDPDDLVTTYTALNLSTDGGGNNPQNGDTAEFLMYSTSHDDATRALILAYFTSKYGVP